MNRIAIIGNGFDIAHGLKTKYQDFIEHLKDEYVSFLKDDIDSSTIREHKFFCLGPKISSRRAGVTDKRYLCQPRMELNTWDDIPRLISVEYRTVNEGMGYDQEYKPTIKFQNRILRSSFEKFTELTWGGIENDYKDQLVQFLTRGSLAASDEPIIALNSDLKDIVDELIFYLNKLDVPPNFDGKIATQLYTKPLSVWHGNQIDSQRLGTARYKREVSKDEKLDNILFLNFNYTSTVDNYLINNTSQGLLLKNHVANDWIPNDINTLARYIHGDLRSMLNNPIIFGYGDEQDEHQQTLEKMSNEFFKHIKSVQYTRTPYYREMIDFADADKFDIVIYGHSCSNTDRTLLNTLFEHFNCVSIQPYLHIASDNSIYNNIYRCFKDKKIMRSRVVDQTNTIQ